MVAIQNVVIYSTYVNCLLIFNAKYPSQGYVLAT